MLQAYSDGIQKYKNFICDSLMWGILGTSGSVISGQIIQSYFLGFDDVIPGRYFLFHNNLKPRFSRYHVVGKSIPEILGFELASFSDKKSRCIWERQRASFLDKKSDTNYWIQIRGFFLNLILRTELESFSDKKQTTFWKWSRFFCPQMTPAQFPEIVFLSRIHG